MSARCYKPRQPGSLKEAEAALITACGGAAAAAAHTRPAKTVLHQAGDPMHPNRHLSVDVVRDLEKVCGQTIVTGYLALEQGCVVEPVKPNCTDPLPVVVGRITSELGELLSAAARDVQVGALTRANAATVLRETDDVVAALLQMRAIARGVLGEGEL